MPIHTRLKNLSTRIFLKAGINLFSHTILRTSPEQGISLRFRSEKASPGDQAFPTDVNSSFLITPPPPFAQQREPFPRAAAFPGHPVKTEKEIAEHYIALEHDRHHLLLIDGGLASAAALGIGGEGLLELVGEAQEIDCIHARRSFFNLRATVVREPDCRHIFTPP